MAGATEVAGAIDDGVIKLAGGTNVTAELDTDKTLESIVDWLIGLLYVTETVVEIDTL